MDVARGPMWDERLWSQVWDRNLTQVERWNTAMAVLRHRPPGTPFEDLVARELAHRLRRRAIFQALMYAAWTLFWGALATGPLPPDIERSTLPRGCAVVGLLAILACVLARRRFGAYLRHHRVTGHSTT